MKRKSYILAIAVMASAMLLAGCGNKDQGNGSGDGEGENSEEALDFDASEYVKLGDYKGLEVTYPSVPPVTDEEVRENIQYELEENTEYKEIKDRAAEEGDIANIDYTGTIGGEEFEGGSDSGYELELGSGDFLEDFENSLIGKKAGETTTFTLTFPEDYGQDVAGKEAEFTVKINSISEAVTPEYNEEFVKSVSDYETTQDYEASVKEKLQEETEESSKMEAEENALRLAIENATIDGYPQKLYDFFYDDNVTGYKNYAEFMGIDYEEKAFYDILKAVAKKYKFEYPEDKTIELSKRIKAVVDDKSRYTDWSTRDDIKADLQVYLILLMEEFDYPPVTIDDVYKEVLEQAENFKKYAI